MTSEGHERGSRARSLASQLRMSKTEALQHRDAAMRHLRALREAHALSSAPDQLTLNPATVRTGAAMLTAVANERGGMSPRTASGVPPAAASLDATASRPPKARPTPRPNLTGGCAAAAPGFGSWRGQIDHSEPLTPRGGAARQSPRGRRTPREDPARAAKESAADWEKEKLLELMQVAQDGFVVR